MLKITLQVKENLKDNTCKVTLINPKDLSKATEQEKITCSMVINEITNTLQSMQESNKK